MPLQRARGSYVGDGNPLPRLIETGLSGKIVGLRILPTPGNLGLSVLFKTDDMPLNACWATDDGGIVGNGVLFVGGDFSVVADGTPNSANHDGATYYWEAWGE